MSILLLLVNVLNITQHGHRQTCRVTNADDFDEGAHFWKFWNIDNFSKN